MTLEVLPEPDCRLGYTESQLRAIVGSRYLEFCAWMSGQTISLCEGKQFNYDTHTYEEACGGVAHGPVTYPHDVERFLRGLPVID